VIDGDGRVRLTVDDGASWTDPLAGGALDIEPMGLMAHVGRFRVLSWFAVGTDGSVLRAGFDADAWVADTPLDIAPVAVTPFAQFTALMAIDAAGAVRTANTSISPLAWVDPLDGGTLGISPTAVNGALQAHVAVSASGQTRVSPDGGVTWWDPGNEAGATPMGVSPVAVCGAIFPFIVTDVVVIDAAATIAVSHNSGTNWEPGPPLGGLAPIVGLEAGASDDLFVVDASGNVRIYAGGAWSTPTGSPIS
jgi:hypothetical protein